MIGRTREAAADAGFDGDRFGVDIDHRKQLVRLFRCGKEVADTAEVGVFLERYFVFLR